MNAHPASLPLDLLTVKVMALVTLLVMSGAAVLGSKINRRVQGLRMFAAGLVLLSVGGALGLARLLFPGVTIVIGCQVFMLCGMITIVQAIRKFRGFEPISATRLAVLITGTAVLFCYWIFRSESFSMRVGVISAAFAMLTLDAAISMFRGVPSWDRVVYWPTGCAFAFTAVYHAVRAMGGFTGIYGSNLFAPVPLELATTICSCIAVIGCVVGTLLASNAQLHQEAQKLALFDPLTNLPNRRYLLERLAETEQRTRAAGKLFGIVYLDLDGFKQINDTLGHAAGDDLLRCVSAAMSGVLRAGDCIARVGGDEFVVIAEHLENRSDIGVLADRLKRTAEAQSGSDNLFAPIRISCGAAVFPFDGTSAERVMHEADEAMYREKHRGRTRAGIAVAV